MIMDLDPITHHGEIVSITKPYLYMSILSSILVNLELSVMVVAAEDPAYKFDILNLHGQVKIIPILHHPNAITVQVPSLTRGHIFHPIIDIAT